MELHVFWFITLGLLLAGYAILDGFDLGVGILHLTARDDRERRIYMNSIGPIWDGNEVWLVVFGGALFAAFPVVYATAFSAFYTPFMFLLCGLIFRAVSIEFRSKTDWAWWRSFWDGAFFLSSLLMSFVFGTVVGTALLGLPLDARGNLAGEISLFQDPFQLMVGALVVSLFAVHGAVYLYLKTEGELQARVRGWIWTSFGIFLAMHLLTTVYALVEVPAASAHVRSYDVIWVAIVLNILAIANIPRAITLEQPFYAFLSSSLTILTLTILFGSALFPNMMVSSLTPDAHRTIYNSSSSDTTLSYMRIMVFLGMPFVLAYTAITYWIFRGKVRLEETSY
ncbi:MAG: cytochrome d ubiquinol oxidase subunit II [Armatimonadetes bacterium]|nr:cytochrome d ubiquinol oxidase subunit II [Armatimonadota bacterium]